ncbi:UDP-2,4-diacetamido-2,4,6-trideoxy-beta-L-altropyranose hydrolase [Clostridium botulinum]|uniref:cytidylyltransferase domain-containing protein n=1 Tax=Clostridium botulinum TaxID=1491 RepID=UPI000A174DBD|nr:glycosyltransferase [Clostridium botulinum]AUN11673.1 UDP-2,4-diacetamido-2,4,6-trideoxy-beta-L-altropyranose hydrolase [Clostridium botulinum]AUN22616.1 UDP-2,4-diacetamido-2,4,6-trideoxy-beta-L-altropyranose hydrolase [Clostridium botulinum]AUN26326.1 UDP-2,4-diacetamido-2,4,6-trideoxy-beta-L-altropyranose hydrolase [Clostridium botulinum]OSA71690.1 UDP-2,4-diacetamido-2,4,6-trideoxy-beta-L-altropyranose hydrolase [Clostridium botulinum]QDY22093.1 UDP-2,4-diacetamido-2,4,6-trideoxy-beta-L
MYNDKKIAVCIPARGGSKGIPRKNVRLLAGKPLITYVIDELKKSSIIDYILITTDDEEIKFIAKKKDISVIERPSNLADDKTPLDPVVYHAVTALETNIKKDLDIIITVQPTSPLLKVKTVEAGIRKIVDENIDTVISVVDDRHLAWTTNEDGKYVPKYEKRINRQYLPSEFRETGAIFATKREFISENSRMGKNIDLIEVSKHESIDIDSYSDWWVAERLLKRKKIVIRADATNEIGTGHIYRGMNIASKITEHEVVFLMDCKCKLGIEIVGKNNYPIYTFENNLLDTIDKLNPDIIINDILDTDKEYIKELKNKGIFTINFEDLGEGAKYANLVFNALYEHKIPLRNAYSGYKYYILRDEFYGYKDRDIKETVNNILVTFGGTDPSNLTEKTLEALLKINYDKDINVVLGLGYKDKKNIHEKYKNFKNISIHNSIKNMSEYMYNADLVITSGGRTMYEVVSLKTPCLVLCQNERELTHIFGHSGNGVINLGMGKYITDSMLRSNLNEVITDFELRKEMKERMESIDLSNGFKNIFDLAKEEYSKFKLNFNI